MYLFLCYLYCVLFCNDSFLPSSILTFAFLKLFLIFVVGETFGFPLQLIQAISLRERGQNRKQDGCKTIYLSPPISSAQCLSSCRRKKKLRIYERNMNTNTNTIQTQIQDRMDAKPFIFLLQFPQLVVWVHAGVKKS